MIQIFDSAWVDADLITGLRTYFDQTRTPGVWKVEVHLDNGKSMWDTFTTEKDARRKMNQIAKKVKNATAEAEKHELRFYR